MIGFSSMLFAGFKVLLGPMISIESCLSGQQTGSVPPPPVMSNLQFSDDHHPLLNGASGLSRAGISNELPTAYVTSTPLPLAKASQQQQQQEAHFTSSNQPFYLTQHHPHHLNSGRMMSDEDKAESEKNAIISSLFEEIRLEATLFGGRSSSIDINKQEEADDGDQPTALNDKPPTTTAISKKLKKRKSDLALEMSADDVDDILGGDSASASNFNPKNPFGGPSPSGLSNGFVDLGSPGGSTPFASSSQKSSPPLSKYSQNIQGQRNSPPSHQGYRNMSPYMTSQMNSPLHPQLQPQSSPPVSIHSPGQQEFKPTIINGVMMNPMGSGSHPHAHHLPHHTRFLQHQQSAPNLRLGTPEEQQQQQQVGLPYAMGGANTGAPPPAHRPFDRSLVEEFEMCVRAVLMASHRVYCRHVYRQLTAEVSELYARVAKNQVPKKAVKKIAAARQPATPGERIELERQFKCLADGLESRQSPQLYESILNFLYKMRVAIPDVTQ